MCFSCFWPTGSEVTIIDQTNPQHYKDHGLMCRSQQVKMDVANMMAIIRIVVPNSCFVLLEFMQM